jgi:AraC-like DNA-binding protein
LTATPLFATEGLLLRRVVCDGADGPRPVEEGSPGARVILVLSGHFAYTDRCIRAVASPAVALFLKDGETYRIHHVDGQGDLCLAFEGELPRALVAAGATARLVSTGSYLRLRGLAATLARGEPLTRLSIEEALSTELAPSEPALPPVRSRERDVAEAIAHELGRNFGARLSLSELARNAGVSVFHACRLFKQATGKSIHRYQCEIRLRHALAWLVETDLPIARIALDSGFANQAHLTNLFRRRFGSTPGQLRKHGSAVNGTGS